MYLKSLVAAVALLAASSSVTLAAHRFRVYNHSSYTIDHVYVLYDDGTQSEDLLGDTTVLDPHYSVLVLADGHRGCVAHVLVEQSPNDGGDTAEFFGINTCNGDIVEVSDESFGIDI